MTTRAFLLGVLLSCGLAGCNTASTPARQPPTTTEAKLISDVLSTRNRLSWRHPLPATDPVRQEQVLGWFVGQLKPSAPVPPRWLQDRKSIVRSLTGEDLDFPLRAAADLNPQLSREQVIEAWLNANLLQNDPHSRYLPGPRARDLDKILRIYDMGLGISVIEDAAFPGGVRIDAISQGSPAATNKRLLETSQLLGWRIPGGQWQVSSQAGQWRSAFEGEMGTTISLRWRNPPSKRVFSGTFTRSWWSLAEQRTTGKIVDKDGLRLGIVRVPLFYNQNEQVNTSQDLRKQRDQLRAAGADVLVLDLRGNPGGYWQEAIASAGVFSPGKLVANALGGNSLSIALSAPDWDDPWNGPVWIWVDRNTASAAEVLAGFLRLENGACLVGERTSGKGSIQILAPLNPSGDRLAGQVVITTMLYRWSDGTTPQYWGLAPDAWTREPSQTDRSGERAFPNPIRLGGRPHVPPMDWPGRDRDWLEASMAVSACQKS